MLLDFKNLNSFFIFNFQFNVADKMTSSMLYDSEYDNYGPSSLASDDLYDDALLDVAASKQLIGGEDKIRRVSQHITRSFGQPSQRNLSTSSDSEDA